MRNAERSRSAQSIGHITVEGNPPRASCAICSVVCCFESEAHFRGAHGRFELEHAHIERFPVRDYFTLSIEEELARLDQALLRAGFAP